MIILNGSETLDLAQKIVKLVYSDEYRQQFKSDITDSYAEENWIKSDGLKKLLRIDHPLVTAYIRQVDVIYIQDQNNYNGNLRFQFRIPNKYKTEDIQDYTFAHLLNTYGNLRGAIWELYQLAKLLWEPGTLEWGANLHWRVNQFQWVPSNKLAAALDSTHTQLMDYMISNMLDISFDSLQHLGWHFFQHDNQPYIGISNYYFHSMISLEEFLMFPMNRQIDKNNPAITLQGRLNEAVKWGN